MSPALTNGGLMYLCVALYQEDRPPHDAGSNSAISKPPSPSKVGILAELVPRYTEI